MVQKGYRSQPYHNWMHAFSVVHCCYLFLKNVPRLKDYLSDLERFCLFVACLSHDIDHRGRTNSFQVAQKTVLAQLYSSAGSVMEQHHFRFTVSILACEGCNILDDLSAEKYQEALNIIQHVILSTDLQTHVRSWSDVELMLKQGFDSRMPEHRKLLLSLLVRCCDISDQTKMWVDSKFVAALVYEEFFSEGDEVKEKGVSPSNVMMDRERAFIPDIQIDFLKGFLIPMIRALAQMLPEVTPVYQNVLRNLACWTVMRDLVIAKHIQAFASPCQSPLEILRDSEIETQVLRSVAETQPSNKNSVRPEDVLLEASSAFPVSGSS